MIMRSAHRYFDKDIIQYRRTIGHHNMNAPATTAVESRPLPIVIYTLIPIADQSHILPCRQNIRRRYIRNSPGLWPPYSY